MKFSACHVDFSSPSPDPLDSRKPAHVGVTPVKVAIYLSSVGLFSVQMVADTHSHAAYRNKH